MNVRVSSVAVSFALFASGATADPGGDAIPSGRPVLWHARSDVRRLDLVYGPGGREGAPRNPFQFKKEDLGQSSPKYEVVDANGVKWKVKLGQEAQPETAANRLLWAMGYSTADLYYLPEIRVTGVPTKLKRGREFVDADGTMHGARFKREPEGSEKIGHWQWKHNPFQGTREFNGLRTLMALLNNWDLKDENTAIVREGNAPVYQVSDLGASFGTAGYAYPERKSKGNLDEYRRAKFVCRLEPREVDFCSPARTAIVRAVAIKEFIQRWHMRWIAHDIPRADARWMGEQLSQLTAKQIRDVFRAAGYGANDVEAFAQVVEHRIGELTEL